MTPQAQIPPWTDKQALCLWKVLHVPIGIAVLALLAQIAIPLPWTPVPITGQTFGVTMIAFVLGQRRAVTSVFSYVLLGCAGLPVFAMGSAGAWISPTTGYLVGMILSAAVVGRLADQGLTRSFAGAWMAALCGSVCVFSCGLVGLAFFVPTDNLLDAGVFPFLPGDFIKTTVAALLTSRLQNPKGDVQ